MFFCKQQQWAFVALAACLAWLARGQAAWDADQVNTTLCYWEQPRAAVIRDTVFIDGGQKWWLPGLSSGGYGALAPDDNQVAIVWKLNFSKPFDTTDNLTAVLDQLPKTQGAANNIMPNYFDGAMLANNAEFFLYGGLLRQTAAFSPPPGSQISAYQEFQYGVDKPAFQPGFLQPQLPDGMTRYVAYGGAANAPSENKGWYFSGLRSPSWGPIYLPSSNVSLNAVNVSNTLLTLDMSTQQQEIWQNDTLPPSITGRANPELVWVPVGPNGILVALGGVTFPEFAGSTHISSNEAASKQQSPEFMSTIDIYDVGSKTWYQQPTTGGPGQLTRGCAVVAPAQDFSSFNIYYYGGYDGLHVKDSTAFNDDVWVLSLPSFTWTRVSSGTSGHARAGHKCVMPYPDVMFVIGGYTAMSGGSPTCLQENFVQIFNLSSTTWTKTYDPVSWANYSVPEAIFKKIGGTATGGATATTPSATTWATSGLGPVFATPYPVSKLNSYHTYTPTPTQNNTNPGYTPKPKSSGVPKWLPPVLGVILGLIFVTSLVVIFMLWRRRKYLRSRNGSSESGTIDTGNRILAWMRGQPPEIKSPTVTTSDDTPSSPGPEMEMATPYPHAVTPHELHDTQLNELADTSPRAAELSGIGLSPIEIVNRRFASAPGAQHDPSSSYYGSVSQTDHASSVSQSSDARAVAAPTPPGAGAGGRANSPALDNTAQQQQPGNGHGGSGVSAVSERDRAHLRNISDPTTVGSMDSPGVKAGGGSAGGAQPRGAPVIEEQGEDTTSPMSVSPPTAGAHDAEDYVSAGPSPRSERAVPAGAGSPLRRSVFHESRDDLGPSP